MIWGFGNRKRTTTTLSSGFTLIWNGLLWSNDNVSILYWKISDSVWNRSNNYHVSDLNIWNKVFHGFGPAPTWAQFHQHIYVQLFTPIAPKSIRIKSSCQYLFTLLGSTGVKAARRTLMKLSLVVTVIWFYIRGHFWHCPRCILQKWSNTNWR